MSSTALYADLVLPVTTIFEDTSLMAGVRSQYVQLMEKPLNHQEKQSLIIGFLPVLLNALVSVTYLINLLSTILILASRDRGLRGKC